MMSNIKEPDELRHRPRLLHGLVRAAETLPAQYSKGLGSCPSRAQRRSTASGSMTSHIKDAQDWPTDRLLMEI